jgi:hypothetical protein
MGLFRQVTLNNLEELGIRTRFLRVESLEQIVIAHILSTHFLIRILHSVFATLRIKGPMARLCTPAIIKSNQNDGGRYQYLLLSALEFLRTHFLSLSFTLSLSLQTHTILCFHSFVL